MGIKNCYRNMTTNHFTSFWRKSNLTERMKPYLLLDLVAIDFWRINVALLCNMAQQSVFNTI